jgi:hypothetical protein
MGLPMFKINSHPVLTVLVSLISVAGVALVFSNHLAFAATYNVTTSSACTLPDAITASDTDATAGSCSAGDASNTINLAAGTYTLAANLPTITDNNLTVNGAGPEQTIIDGSNTYSMFDIESSGLNTVFSNFTTIGVGGTNPTWYSIDDGEGNGMLTISNVVFRDSTAGGGVFVNESGSITNSAIENVRGPNGGEVMFDSFGSGTFNIINTTLADSNYASAIWVDVRSGGTINLINDTIADNTTSEGAAGVELWGTNGDGPETTVNLENTILDNNVLDDDSTIPANCGTEPVGQFPSLLPTSLGYNISSDDSCSTVLTQAGDLNNTDPLLGSLTLEDNIYVLPITASSPAYNAANGAVAPATDQRGISRPQCGGFDIGAFELACVVSTPSVLGDSITVPNTGFGVASNNVSAAVLYTIIGSAATFGIALVFRKLYKTS